MKPDWYEFAASRNRRAREVIAASLRELASDKARAIETLRTSDDPDVMRRAFASLKLLRLSKRHHIAEYHSSVAQWNRMAERMTYRQRVDAGLVTREERRERMQRTFRWITEQMSEQGARLYELEEKLQATRRAHDRKRSS